MNQDKNNCENARRSEVGGEDYDDDTYFYANLRRDSSHWRDNYKINCSLNFVYKDAEINDVMEKFN